VRSVSGTPRGFGSPARTQILTLATMPFRVTRQILHDNKISFDIPPIKLLHGGGRNSVGLLVVNLYLYFFIGLDGKTIHSVTFIKRLSDSLADYRDKLKKEKWNSETWNNSKSSFNITLEKTSEVK
jgi:hypothetical protein